MNSDTAIQLFPTLVDLLTLDNLPLNLIIVSMTEKEIVLETIRALPDDCSLEEIAERIEFMAAVQKGLDQLDRGEGIPHDEVKRQLASWLTS
jgi:predicted transcriptional regulator